MARPFRKDPPARATQPAALLLTMVDHPQLITIRLRLITLSQSVIKIIIVILRLRPRRADTRLLKCPNIRLIGKFFSLKNVF